MSLANPNSIILSLLFAVLVWFIGDIVINFFIADPAVNRMFHGILLIIVLIIAIAGSFIFPF